MNPQIRRGRETPKRPDLDRIDVSAVVERLGIRVRGLESGWLTAWCIFHADGKNPNLRIKPHSGGKFRCLSCGATGNLLHLVEQQLGVDREGAWDYLRGLSTRTPTAESIRSKLRGRTEDMHIRMVQQMELHLGYFYHVLLAESPSRLARRATAHAQRSPQVHEYMDPDYYTIRAMVDELDAFMLPRIRAVGNGDISVYIEFLDEINNIWTFAQRSGYLDRFPYAFIQRGGWGATPQWDRVPVARPVFAELYSEDGR